MNRHDMKPKSHQHQKPNQTKIKTTQINRHQIKTSKVQPSKIKSIQTKQKSNQIQIP